MWNECFNFINMSKNERKMNSPSGKWIKKWMILKLSAKVLAVNLICIKYPWICKTGNLYKNRVHSLKRYHFILRKLTRALSLSERMFSANLKNHKYLMFEICWMNTKSRLQKWCKYIELTHISQLNKWILYPFVIIILIDQQNHLRKNKVMVGISYRWHKNYTSSRTHIFHIIP